ncbi:MAG: hypothetical protein WKF77_16845 [Planctomycetaceae bacterium]
MWKFLNCRSFDGGDYPEFTNWRITIQTKIEQFSATGIHTCPSSPRGYAANVQAFNSTSTPTRRVSR